MKGTLHMKTIHFIGGAAVATLAVGAVLLSRGSGEGPREPEAGPAASPSSAVVEAPRPAAVEARACLLAPQARLAYQLATRTSAKVDAQSLGAGAGQAVLGTRNSGELHATLQLEALRSLDDGSLMLARLVGVDATTAQAAPGIADTAFLFRLSTSCEPIGFARHRSAPLGGARAQQATLAQLWFRVPRAQTEPAMAENGLGPFRAVLARSGSVVQRRVVAYQQAWGSAQVPSVTDSFLSAQLGSGPWFDALTSREVVSMGVFSSATVEVKVTRATADASVLAQVSRDEGEYVWEDLLPRPVLPSASKEPSREERARLATMVDKPFKEAVREFAAKVVAEPNMDAKWKDLSRYLTVHPEHARDFVGSMQQRGFPEELKALGYVAVGHAQGTEARDALLAVRDDSGAEPYDRIRATLALVGRDDVGVELARALHQDSRAMLRQPNSARGFYGRNALLALGMFSALRQNQDAAVAGVARAAISETLESSDLSAGGGVSFPAAMGAMGNLGDPADLPTLVALSKHPSPEVRAQVPQGMRRLHQDVVADFTLEWLQRETSPDVKQELYSVVQHQLLDDQLVASEALSRQAVKDLEAQPVLLTRQPLVRILAPNASKYDFVRRALVAQAVKEVGTTSGLYSVIAQYVPGDEVSAALALRSGAGPVHPTMKTPPLNPTTSTKGGTP